MTNSLQAQADAALPGPPATKKIRMSTSLQLPGSNKDGVPAQSTQDQPPDSAKQRHTAAARGTFPPEIERYMQAQGFLEATPIQQECVPCAQESSALGLTVCCDDMCS